MWISHKRQRYQRVTWCESATRDSTTKELHDVNQPQETALSKSYMMWISHKRQRVTWCESAVGNFCGWEFLHSKSPCSLLLRRLPIISHSHSWHMNMDHFCAPYKVHPKRKEDINQIAEKARVVPKPRVSGKSIKKLTRGKEQLNVNLPRYSCLA